MRVYIQIKQLGKRKCSIEKIPIELKEESTLTFIRLAMLSGRLW